MEYKGFIYAPTPKTAWDNLSMQEKSEMMKVAVRNGITDLKTIREKYNEFAEGGNLPENNLSETNQFGGGGYVPSRAIRQRIANWEGAAMDRDTIDPLSGKMAKKNRSFEEVATGFVNAIPKDIRGQVLGNQELADNLYSYAYNVGPGKFKERVVPALRRYYQGNGSVSEVTDSMWASGDKKLRGLRRRRTEERSGVSRALQGDNTANPVSYTSQTDNNGFVPFQPMLPEVFEASHPVVPYSIADTPKESQEVAVSPYDIKVLEGQRRRDNLQHFMNVLNMVYGDDAEDGGSFFLPLGALGYNNTFEDGGKIHIKPKNRGKFTALKERTGHSATWFKEHGTPAQKKMAIFELNSRHWKHGLGGNLFDDGGDLFVKYVDSYRVNPETGGVYDKTGEVKEGAVILPEVEVVGRPLGNYAIQREADRMRGIQSNQGLSGADPVGQFAVETATLNPVFKLAGTAGLYGLGRYGESLTGFARPQNWARGKLVSREMDRSPFGSIGSPVLQPIKRTRVGDVEIDNPGLYYHQADAGKAENFVSTGRMRTPLEEYWLAKEEAGEKIPLVIRSGVKPGYPQDPGSAMFAQGHLWYGLTPNKPDLLVTAREMPIANKNASIMSNRASLRALEEQGSRRVTNDNVYTQGPHNRQNTTAYVWEPGYGYKRVFAEDTPAAQWVKEGSVNASYLDGKPEIGMYFPDGKTFNTKAFAEDLGTGIADTRLFLGSEIKAASDAHNIELAKRVGFPRFTPYARAQERASIYVKPQLTADKNTLAGSVEKNTNDPALDKMTINVLYDADKGGFHETLHRGNYGEEGFFFDPEIMKFMNYHKIQEDTRNFYNFKTNKLLVPRTEDNAKWYDYMSRSAEAATNSMELGRRMGLKPGTPWPGKKKAMELYEKYSTSNDQKTKAFNVLNWKQKPRRVWDALTGRYFILGAGTVSTASLNNN